MRHLWVLMLSRRLVLQMASRDSWSEDCWIRGSMRRGEDALSRLNRKSDVV